MHIALLSPSHVFLNGLRLFSGMYLVYLGINCLKQIWAYPLHLSVTTPVSPEIGGFLNGFINNILNPKALLFVSVVLSQGNIHTISDHLKLGSSMILQSLLYWNLLVVLLGIQPVRKKFLRFQKAINVMSGILLILLGTVTLLH